MWKKFVCALCIILFCGLFSEQAIQAGMESVTVTSVHMGDDLSFTYNEGNWQGYTFVPEETGYYYCTLDATGGMELQLYVEGEDEPVWKKSKTYSDTGKEIIYLVEDRAYSLYGNVANKTAAAVLQIRKKTNQQKYINVEVEKLPDVSYTGKTYEPKPMVKFKGQEISTVASNINYVYHFNKEPGVAVVTVSFEVKNQHSFYDYYEIQTAFVIRQPMGEAEVTMPEYTYTGSAIIPEPVVKIKGWTLKQGKDYTLEAANYTDTGTGSVKITGIGKYEGSIQKEFYIRPAEWKIELQDTFIKNKKSKSFKLNPKSDVVLSYVSNNKKVARVDNTGKVKIKGYGTAVITVTAGADKNHTGKKVAVKIIVTSKTGKITSVKRTAKNKAIVSLQKISDAAGYEISYSTDKNFQKEVKKVTTKKKSAIMKNLKNDTTYYVRVRTYRKVNGKKLYSDYSKIRTYSHKK